MRCGLMVWSLGAVWMAAVAAPPPSPVPREILFGREYVPLREWARAQGLSVSWRPAEDEVRLGGGSLRAEFVMNTQRARLDGVVVWLSFPVVARGRTPYVSGLDVAAVLQPAFHPPRLPEGRRPTRVVLDAGHGGKDPGNESRGRKEKFYTLLLAKETRIQLERAGFTVLLTRDSDRFVELETRAELAHRLRGDLLVSLHFNSTPGDRIIARGTEVYCLAPPRARPTNGGRSPGEGAAWPGNRFDPHNFLLAYQVQRALVRQTGVEDRGVRRSRFAVLREARLPAVLIEGAFMTDPGDARRMYDAAERARMARAIADGVSGYCRLVAPGRGESAKP